MYKFGLRWVLLATFCAILVPATAVVAVANYWLARQSALDAAGALVAEVNRTIFGQVEILFGPTALTAAIMPLVPAITGVPPAVDHPALGLMGEILQRVPNVASIYVGYEDGNFMRLASLSGRYAQDGAVLGAPPNAVRGVQAVTTVAGRRRQVWRFVGDDGATLAEAIDNAPTYDPRTRPWYGAALASPDIIVTPPYVFASTGEVGITVAHRVETLRGAVVGVDLSLAAVSDYLATVRSRWTYPVAIAVIDGANQVVATSQPLPAGAARTFLSVDDLGDPGLSAAVRQFSASGHLFASAALKAGAGLVIAAVQPVPVDLGQASLYLVIAAPFDDFVAPLLRAAERSALAAMVIALLSVPLIVLLAARLAWPLRQIADESDRIRHFDVGHPFQVTSRIREVADLATSTGHMKSTLSAFAKYVPGDLVRAILDSGIEPTPGGARKPVTLLFTDIEGFTTLSERIAPEALMLKMSAYLERMVTEILRHEGTVDKYVGDAIMAYWNAPKDQPGHEIFGCRAALACRVLSNQMNDDWRAAGEEPLYTRFGLHTGDCIVGNVGSTTRLDFTVLGSPVNLASRLEGLNKHYGTQVLTSQSVRNHAGPDFVFRPVDLVLPKGAVTPILLHELVGVRAGSAEAERLPGAVVAAADLARCEEWERLYALFAAGDWSRMIPEVGAFASAHPKDKLAAVYLKRAWLNAFSPPDGRTDGVERFQTK